MFRNQVIDYMTVNNLIRFISMKSVLIILMLSNILIHLLLETSLNAKSAQIPCTYLELFQN